MEKQVDAKFGQVSTEMQTMQEKLVEAREAVIDLEKAFDKIGGLPHRRLISKLHSYCIHNNIVEWLEAFLSNRKQRVRIGNTFSNWQQLSAAYHKVQS